MHWPHICIDLFLHYGDGLFVMTVANAVLMSHCVDCIAAESILAANLVSESLRLFKTIVYTRNQVY
jgi:hypothetical protein